MFKEPRRLDYWEDWSELGNTGMEMRISSRISQTLSLIVYWRWPDLWLEIDFVRKSKSYVCSL